MLDKLGLSPSEENIKLITLTEEALQLSETDMTIFFRNLSTVSKEDTSKDVMTKIKDAFYKPDDVTKIYTSQWNNWTTAYIKSLQKESDSDQERQIKMNAVNPKYVLRNYIAQLAIEDADKGNYNLIDELFILLKNPYDEQPEHEKWFAKRPDWARNKIGCSMLSCSS